MSSSEDVHDLALLQEMLVDYPPTEEKPPVEEDPPSDTAKVDSSSHAADIITRAPRKKYHGRRWRHRHVPNKALVMVYRLCPKCHKGLLKDRQRVRRSGESTFIRFKLCPRCAHENLVLNPVL